MTDVVDDVDVTEDEISGDEDMPTLWAKLEAAIQSLDSEMDAWNPSLRVRKEFLDSLVAEKKEIWAPQAASLIEQLKTVDDRVRYSLYAGLVGELNKAFQKTYNEWVEAEVEKLPKPEVVEVTPEERKVVSEKRSKYYGMMKQLKDMADTFHMSFASEWVLPKIRRGGAGKRGKRALNFYDWWIDGKELDGDDNTPAGVAKILFGTEGKSSDLTKALKGLPVKDDDGKDTKLNTTKPPKTFTVTINDHEVLAQRSEDEDVEDENEDEEESEEDSDDDE